MSSSLTAPHQLEISTPNPKPNPGCISCTSHPTLSPQNGILNLRRTSAASCLRSSVTYTNKTQQLHPQSLGSQPHTPSILHLHRTWTSTPATSATRLQTPSAHPDHKPQSSDPRPTPCPTLPPHLGILAGLLLLLLLRLCDLQQHLLAGLLPMLVACTRPPIIQLYSGERKAHATLLLLLPLRLALLLLGSPC